MENGRLNITNYKGVVVCDAFLNDEWSVEDVYTLVDEIRKHFSPPSDIIVRKTGSYSVSTEAQTLLETNLPEFGRVVYVADTEHKRSSAEYAKTSYMKHYNVEVADSIEQAYEILRGSQH